MSTQAFDNLIEATESLIWDVIADAERSARGRFQQDDLPLYDVVRYHFGWVDENFAATQADSGKRVRPIVCLLSTGAAGGRTEAAMPVAAAIELLHNFTLMHDDIQDRSELRRGRPTVWQNWGIAQAINAGDATFALSQLALLRVGDYGVEPRLTTELALAFNRVTLQIVEGQVLDLGYEQRWDIRADDYLRMIDGKTAAIVAFAAEAGAIIAGRNHEESGQFHEFGRRLGLGFQIRDDYLGIWGDLESTGKEPGDDIRGRKRSIPIVMMLDQLSDRQRGELRRIYEQPEIGSGDVELITELLDEFQIGRQVQSMAERYHDQALELLDRIAEPSPDRDALAALAERLVERSR